MRPSQSRTVLAVAVGALAFQSLRPVEPVERGLDLVLAPTRLLAELAGPLRWAGGQRLFASDAARARRLAEERGAGAALERAVLAMAAPEDPTILAALAERGIGVLHAEVVDRPRELDRVVLRVGDPARVRHGLPVTSGDNLVGWIDLETPLVPDRPASEVEVVLVTGRDARVGARVDVAVDELPCELVVGGLTPAPALRLDVHNPSNRSTRSGRVRLNEPQDGEGFAWLANGFHLGELGVDEVPLADRPPGAPPARVLGIRPGLDYEAGLYQVLVLLPPGSPAPRPDPRPAAVDDGGWRRARLAVRGEPAAWRRGRKLLLGARGGLELGAAVASGPRFVGRVTRLAWTTADVTLVADEGFRVPALAMARRPGTASPGALEPSEALEPHVLGELVSLGPGEPGHVLLRWSGTLPLEGDTPLPATVWTGSGAPGVPRGLLLGTTELPPGPGPHLLDLRLAHGDEEPRSLVVRAPRGEGAP